MPGGPAVGGPKIRILGTDMAGQVEAVGRRVTGFKAGDNVYGMLRGGGFGEYVCVPADALAPMPRNLSHEQAAAVPMAGSTALVALREVGKVQPGQNVLVTGASGGVGTFAVQIARAYGASVTGVCRTRNVDLVRSIGADEVVDATREDFTRTRSGYDLVVDIAGTRPARAARRALRPKGTYVAVGGPGGRWLHPVPHMIATMALGPFVSQRMAVADVFTGKATLPVLTELLEDGRVVPVIDRQYTFDDIPEAVRYQERGHASGKVVVTY
jgi:NADPH:quinone reductase-like Zn-dependent oxidoreductase